MSHLDPVLEEAAVQYGCLRVRELAQVHEGSDLSDWLAAVNVVWEYFGLDDQAKQEILSLITEYLPLESAGAVLLGFLAALYAFEYET